MIYVVGDQLGGDGITVAMTDRNVVVDGADVVCVRVPFCKFGFSNYSNDHPTKQVEVQVFPHVSGGGISIRVGIRDRKKFDPKEGQMIEPMDMTESSCIDISVQDNHLVGNVRGPYVDNADCDIECQLFRVPLREPETVR